MEYPFENTGISDVKALTEVQYRTTWKTLLSYALLYVMVIVYYVRLFVMGGGDPLLYGFFVAILAFTVWWFMNPYLRVRKAVRQVEEFYNGQRPENTILFGDDICIQREDASRNWEYDHIVKVYSWKHSNCLRMKNRVILSFSRDNFTKGTFEEFKQFLRTKRPDLRIPE